MQILFDSAKDSFEFLEYNQINEFNGAIQEGHTFICDIAKYYVDVFFGEEYEQSLKEELNYWLEVQERKEKIKQRASIYNIKIDEPEVINYENVIDYNEYLYKIEEKLKQLEVDYKEIQNIGKKFIEHLEDENLTQLEINIINRIDENILECKTINDLKTLFKSNILNEKIARNFDILEKFFKDNAEDIICIYKYNTEEFKNLFWSVSNMDITTLTKFSMYVVMKNFYNVIEKFKEKNNYK